jgi:hypothetical protein
LPTHIVIPQIANVLRCTEFKACGDPFNLQFFTRLPVQGFITMISSYNFHIDRNPAAGSILELLCRS